MKAALINGSPKVNVDGSDSSVSYEMLQIAKRYLRRRHVHNMEEFHIKTGILGEKDHEIVDKAMAATDTSDLSGTDYGKISDGQRQRVRLARSIAQEPKVLLLDEPTVYLDIRYQAQFMRLLRTLCRERQMAAIVSMHEVGMALASADKLLCLKDGAVYAFGTAQELRESGCLPGLYGVEADTLDPEYGTELADYLRQNFGIEKQ